MKSLWSLFGISLVPALALGAASACSSDSDRNFAGSGGIASGGTAGSSSGGSSASGASGGSSGSGASGGSAGSSASGGSSGKTGCVSDEVCVPKAPTGWSEPVAMVEQAGPALPSCLAAYPTKGPKANSDFQPGAASCKCSCGTISGIKCTASAGLYRGVSNCFNGGGTFQQYVSPSSCTNPKVSISTRFSVKPPAPSNHGSCKTAANHVLPTPTWGKYGQICTANYKASACGNDGLCAKKIATPFKLCVYRPGDHDCPKAVFTDKTLTYGDFTDNRTCGTCTCKASSKCQGSVVLGSSCSSSSLTKTLKCNQTTSVLTSDYLKYVPSPIGSCAPNKPSVSGTAVPTGQTTTCCQP